MPIISLREFIEPFETSALARWNFATPWELTGASEAVVRKLMASLPAAEFDIADDVAVHETAVVETGAVLKGPLIVGPACFVASGAYLRGGNWIAEHCTFGPGVELKASFVFARTKLAHFNFVGESILGTDVNLEAGSVICNYRNERENAEIRVRSGGELHRTGCAKFGAVVGDHSRIGANAVLAPGAILPRSTVVRRASLWDDEAPRSDA